MTDSSGSNATRIVELVKYCRTPFVLKAKPGDNVHIITDTRQDPLVWQALSAAAFSLDCEVTVSIMTPRAHHHDDPTRPIAAAMKEADINVYCNTIALGFRASRAAREAGAMTILMDELNAEILTSPAAMITAEEDMAMHEFGRKAQEILLAGDDVHITSPSGTDLKCKLRNPETSKVRSGLPFTWPDGELNSSPIPGTGEGIIVWDTSCAYPVGLLKDPIILAVEKGRVTNIDGGAEAKEADAYIKKYGDEDTYLCPTELAWGLNPMAVPTGAMRTDKKVLGGIHTAMGTGQGLHTDGITMSPTIHIDGKPFMIDGVFQIGDGRPF